VKRPLGQTLLIAVTVTLGAALMLVFVTGTVRSFINSTGSMIPTLPLRSHMLVLRSSRVERSEIVTFRYPLDERVTFVKRIVGLPGDTIEIRAKKLIVNGHAVPEPYVIHVDDVIYPNLPSMPEPYRSRDNFGPFHVPEGQLFVLGDNRDQSADSRYWGTLGRNQVTGHPILLYSLKRGVWRP
jgi:signal peptidase I